MCLVQHRHRYHDAIKNYALCFFSVQQKNFSSQQSFSFEPSPILASPNKRTAMGRGYAWRICFSQAKKYWIIIEVRKTTSHLAKEFATDYPLHLIFLRNTRCQK